MDANNPTGYAQVIEQLTPSGVLLASYVYGLEPLSQSQARTISYYLLDGHSGVRLLLNNSNVVLASYRYDAYGVTVASTGNVINRLGLWRQYALVSRRRVVSERRR